jgi:thiol:disulfide interchange protein
MNLRHANPKAGNFQFAPMAVIVASLAIIIAILMVKGSPQTAKATTEMNSPLAWAMERAKEENKPMMIDFYTTWCGPCKMLDRNTFSDPRVREWMTENVIFTKVDGDKHRGLIRKYGVRAYPTVVFISPEGRELGRLRGYRPPSKFLPAAQRFATPRTSPVMASQQNGLF